MVRLTVIKNSKKPITMKYLTLSKNNSLSVETMHRWRHFYSLSWVPLQNLRGPSIKEREGIALAKKKGVYKGSKRSLSANQIVDLHQRVAAGAKKSEVAKEMRISKATAVPVS